MKVKTSSSRQRTCGAVGVAAASVWAYAAGRMRKSRRKSVNTQTVCVCVDVMPLIQRRLRMQVRSACDSNSCQTSSANVMLAMTTSCLKQTRSRTRSRTLTPSTRPQCHHRGEISANRFCVNLHTRPPRHDIIIITTSHSQGPLIILLIAAVFVSLGPICCWVDVARFLRISGCCTSFSLIIPHRPRT